jgi:FtsZ-interacting cell division protein ZipA
MDFSEIIVTIIISLVIIAINALGSKKKQEVKNQQGERPLQDTESHETTDEPWGETRTLTIDDIFKELRKAKEEAEQEDDYIPKAKKKPQTQILERPAEKTPEPIIPPQCRRKKV